MGKLLHASLIRLFKSKLFWLGMIFMLLMVGYTLNRCRYLYETDKLETAVFHHINWFGQLAAVFCGLFIGMDYQNGTICNKLVKGHRRSSLYLVNQISCTLAVVLMLSLQIALVAVIGSGFMDWGALRRYDSPIEDVIPDIAHAPLYLCGSLLITIEYCAIFTLIGMLCSKMLVSVLAGYLLAYIEKMYGWVVFMYAIGGHGYVTLFPPVFVGGLGTWLESWEVSPGIKEYMVHYPEESPWFTALAHVFPGAQRRYISYYRIEHLASVCVCAVIITILVTLIGMYLFEKKNID